MRRLHSFLAACCLLAPIVPAHAARPVTLCFERTEVQPWRTLDGKGLNFELLAEVARRLGIAFDYQSMPWKRCLAQLQANEVDGAFAASFSRERLALGVYPGAAADGEQADPARRMHMDTYLLVRRKGSRVDWDGKRFTGLDGRVGVQLGYSVADFLRAHNILVDEGSQRYDELAEKLVAGRLAAAAVGGGVALRLKDLPFADQLEVRPVPLIEKPYYLVLSHDFARRDAALARRIWQTIEEVRNTPAYQRRERDMLGGRN